MTPCVRQDSAVGYVMERVDMVMVGAEAVVESGGIINTVCLVATPETRAGSSHRLATAYVKDGNVPYGGDGERGEQALLRRYVTFFLNDAFPSMALTPRAISGRKLQVCARVPAGAERHPGGAGRVRQKGGGCRVLRARARLHAPGAHLPSVHRHWSVCPVFLSARALFLPKANPPF